MKRYQFWLSGEDCGIVVAPTLDEAISEFTEKDMIAYDKFTSIGAWFEEMHRLQVVERNHEQVEVVCLDTGMTLSMTHHIDEDDE